MHTSLRLGAVVIILSLTSTSSLLFAANTDPLSLLERSSIELDMRAEYDQGGLGYLLQAKEQIENLKRMGSKDDHTQKMILVMDSYLKILENEYVTKTKNTTYKPSTTSSDTTTLQPGSSVLMPPSISVPRRRYRKVDLVSPKTTLLSEDEFNKKRLSTVNLPKSATKNNAVLFKKIGATALEKKQNEAATQVTTIQIVKKPTTTTKPSTEPTNKLIQQVLDEAKPVKTVSKNDSLLNISTLRMTWIGWVNDLRAQQKLTLYTHEPALDVTAEEWSRTMASKQSADHKRTDTSKYYAYDEIEQRFRDRGVTFELIGNTTFTENVGWTYLNCEKFSSSSTALQNCTEQAVNNMRAVFDYFVAEKDQEYRPHWSSMVHPIYSKVGVGFFYDVAQKRLYITIHYSNPLVRTNK